MATTRKRNGKRQVQVRRPSFKPITNAFQFKTDEQELAREQERLLDRFKLSEPQDDLKQISSLQEPSKSPSINSGM